MLTSCAPARLAAIAVGLALLAAGCSTGGGSSATAARPPGDSSAPDGTAARPPTGIRIPASIGSLQLIDDQGSKGSLYTSLPGSVRKNLHMALYGDGGGSSRTVVVSGGMGFPVPPGGSADKVRRLFSKWAMGTIGRRATSVATGSAGGSAECASTGANLSCGWVSGKAALTISFVGIPQRQARALVPRILTAIVRT